MSSNPNPSNGKPGSQQPQSNARSAFDRVLPHAPDAERALLGSMLLSKEAVGEAITVLRDAGKDAFFNERHAKLYEVAVSLYDRDQPMDAVVMQQELLKRGLFESLGGYDFLGGLVGAVPSALRASHYAKIVLEKHLLRQLIGATYKVMDAAFDDRIPAEEMFDFAEHEIFSITERRVDSAALSLSHLIEDAFRQIQDRGEDVLTGEPTGYLELDELTCGLQPGELIIVAGRPSMGKTAFGLNIAEHMAIGERERPRPVLFFSLEMSRQQVAQRILCSRARVDSHALRRGRLSGRDLRRLQETADDISHAPFLVDDTSHLSIGELRARARMAFRKHRLQAIFVDYLQLMHAPKSESRQAEVAAISRGLKALAKELNLPVIAMAQLNRATEDKSRQGNRPRMSDLRESGAIEQDADVIMLLHRESYYKRGEAGDADEDNTAEVIIAKQRNGPVDTIKLHFNRQWTRFDNHDPSPRVVPGYVSDQAPESPF
ncbi:Replicative DNA helicase [Phycisphaerae bacterium RAS1]|nr:Replicative DNA helicase [Phycisphaerae bacterium RAS1]